MCEAGWYREVDRKEGGSEGPEVNYQQEGLVESGTELQELWMEHCPLKLRGWYSTVQG